MEIRNWKWGLMNTWNKKTPLLKHILGCIEDKSVEEAERLIADEVESVLWRAGITPMQEQEYLQALYDASTFNYLREVVTRLKAAEANLDYKTMENTVLNERYPILDLSDQEMEKIVSAEPIHSLHRIWHDDLISAALESENYGVLFIEIHIGNGLTLRKGRTMVC